MQAIDQIEGFRKHIFTHTISFNEEAAFMEDIVKVFCHCAYGNSQIPIGYVWKNAQVYLGLAICDNLPSADKRS